MGFVAGRVAVLVGLLGGVVDDDSTAGDALIRLLADVHHLADADGLDVSRLVKLAADRAAAERDEERIVAGAKWGGLGAGLRLRAFGDVGRYDGRSERSDA